MLITSTVCSCVCRVVSKTTSKNITIPPPPPHTLSHTHKMKNVLFSIRSHICLYNSAICSLWTLLLLEHLFMQMMRSKPCSSLYLFYLFLLFTLFRSIFVLNHPLLPADPRGSIWNTTVKRLHLKAWNLKKPWKYFFWSVKCGWILLQNRWNISNAAWGQSFQQQFGGLDTIQLCLCGLQAIVL